MESSINSFVMRFIYRHLARKNVVPLFDPDVVSTLPPLPETHPYRNKIVKTIMAFMIIGLILSIFLVPFAMFHYFEWLLQSEAYLLIDSTIAFIVGFFVSVFFALGLFGLVQYILVLIWKQFRIAYVYAEIVKVNKQMSQGYDDQIPYERGITAENIDAYLAYTRRQLWIIVLFIVVPLTLIATSLTSFTYADSEKIAWSYYGFEGQHRYEDAKSVELSYVFELVESGAEGEKLDFDLSMEVMFSDGDTYDLCNFGCDVSDPDHRERLHRLISLIADASGAPVQVEPLTNGDRILIQKLGKEDLATFYTELEERY